MKNWINKLTSTFPLSKMEVLALSLVSLLFLIFFSIPLSQLGCDNLRMLDAFDVDESLYLSNLREAIKEKNMILHLHWYGDLYYNLGLIPLHLLNLITDIGDKEITTFYRLLSSFFHVASSVTIFVYAKKYFGTLTAWTSFTLLLLSSKTLLYYAVNLHPDTAQIFWFIITFLCLSSLIEKYSIRKVFITAIIIGLSFSTKYIGIFTYPILIWIITKSSNDRPFSKKSSVVTNNLITVAISLLISVFTYAFTSPFGAYKFNFIRVLKHLSSRLSSGIRFEEQNGIIGWFNVLIEQEPVVSILFTIVLVSIPFLLYKTKNNSRNHLILLIFWILFYLAITITRSTAKPIHYLLPIFPFVFIIIGFTLENILKISQWKNHLAVGVGSILFLAFGHQTLTYKNERINFYTNHPAIEAGNWINNNIKTGAIFLSDHYTYIPEQFDYTKRWDLNTVLANDINHTHLIINKKFHYTYLDHNNIDRYNGNIDDFEKCYQFYSSLDRNDNKYYNEVMSVGSIKIFEKK